jgi:hypothetical protein
MGKRAKPDQGVWVRRGGHTAADALPHVREANLECHGRQTQHAVGAAKATMTSDRAEGVSRRPGVLEWMSWRRYLVTTRSSSAATYRLTEETAWQRLREELSRLELEPTPSRPFRLEEAVHHPSSARSGPQGRPPARVTSSIK